MRAEQLPALLEESEALVDDLFDLDIQLYPVTGGENETSMAHSTIHPDSHSFFTCTWAPPAHVLRNTFTIAACIESIALKPTH